MKNKTSFWPKALLLPSDFYFTIIVACIVAFVPVAFQETISTIPSTTIVTNFFKIVLFLLFTGIVIFMGKNFIEFAMFAKYVSERVNKQGSGLEKESDKINFITNKLLSDDLKKENADALNSLSLTIKCFLGASFLLIIMVIIK